MPNTINPYDPVWYVNEALLQLEKSLGMAARVYRGVDKSPQQPGSVIQLRRPGSFTAQDAPSSAQNLNPESLQVTLAYWREVKFALDDKEIATASERIIEDHIRPAAVALADDIDQKLCALYKGVPWQNAVTLSSAGVADITAARRALFNNKVPMSDLHLMIDGYLEEKFLALSAFSQWQGAGDAGVNTQMRGSLGQKFGFEVFSNQNVPSHTSATVADAAGTAVGVNALGATTLAVTAFSANAALKAGDILAVAGDAQQYCVAADITLGASGEGSVTITPALKKATAGGEVVTLTLSGGSGTTKTMNLAFHRNFAVLAMAPLPMTGDGLGARMAVQVDPTTGLALRSRIFYVGDTSKVYVALDCLYGLRVIDPNMAVRLAAA